MKLNFKHTLLTIFITSLFSLNINAAIKGYNENSDKKEISEEKKEDNSLWFFKGYKTEEQKIKENKEKDIPTITDALSSPQLEKNNNNIEKNNVITSDDFVQTPQMKKEIQVNVDRFIAPKVDTVDNYELLRPTTVTHIVNDEDTLWDLAVTHYNDGQLWTKILEDNPSIENPLKLNKGQKVIIYDINTTFNDQKYTKININPYLLNHILHDVIILQDDHTKNENSIIASENQQKQIRLKDKFYAPKNKINLDEIYNIYRFNKDIEALGQEYVQVGEATSVEYIDELVLMKVVKVKDYLLQGDILIKKEYDIKESFNKISSNKLKTTGSVLSLVNNKKTATLFDLIILDLTNKKAEAGSVMNIYSKPMVIKDENSGIESIIPSKELAEIVVVKAEDNFSLAVISKLINPVSVGDTIK